MPIPATNLNIPTAGIYPQTWEACSWIPPWLLGLDHVPMLFEHTVLDTHDVDDNNGGAVRVRIATVNHYIVAFGHHDTVLPLGSSGQ